MGLFSGVKKAVSKATKSVSKAVKSVSKGVEKVAQGKVAEGLGDIGQTAARVGLDTVTAGNKKLVDSLSGGALTAAEGAARGNSADLTRLGVTGGAAFFGGPAAAMAVNQGFAVGGAQGGLAAGLGGFGIPGAGLIAGQLTDLVGSGGSMRPSPAPMVSEDYFSDYSPSGGSSGGRNNTMIIMAAAFMGLLLILVFFLMRRGKR